MGACKLAPAAERDLLDIWRYVGQRNPPAADRLITRLVEAAGLLAERPNLGRARNELRPGLRSFPMGRYVIFYRQASGGVEIVRVLSGQRDVVPLID
jgi:toxin ParE1/3/4